MNYAKTVAEYFEINKMYHQELMMLREIILSTELEEKIKWGIPVYTLNGKNIVGFGSFKSYFGLWFYQGVFLKDSAKVLYNAQEGVTKALRQWRFSSIDEIDPELVLKYVREAIQNQKDGKELKAEKKKMPDLPKEMKELFNEEPKTKEMFRKLTPFKQREFIEYVASAKREETRLSRTEKIAVMISSGLGLNDKYR